MLIRKDSDTEGQRESIVNFESNSRLPETDRPGFFAVGEKVGMLGTSIEKSAHSLHGLLTGRTTLSPDPEGFPMVLPHCIVEYSG